MRFRTLRALALTATVLLTATTLAACGDDSSAGSNGEAKTIRLGYFPNITHAPALVGVNKGFFQQALGSTKLAAKTFNAGPAQPGDQRLGPVQGHRPEDHRRQHLRGRRPDRQAGHQRGRRPQGQEDRHAAARQHPGRRVPQLDRGAGLEGRRAERQG